MFITIKDILAVRSGGKKAKRDFKRIQQFRQYHDERHAADESWSCGAENAAFYASLAQDVDGAFEHAGYHKVSEKIQQQEIEKQIEKETADPFGGAFGNATVIPINLSGDETQEEIRARVTEALMNQKAFEDVVSETKPEDDDTKGGK